MYHGGRYEKSGAAVAKREDDDVQFIDMGSPEIIPTGKSNEIHVQKKEVRKAGISSYYIDIRGFYTDRYGKLQPTTKGIYIPADVALVVQMAIKEMATELLK